MNCSENLKTGSVLFCPYLQAKKWLVWTADYISWSLLQHHNNITVMFFQFQFITEQILTLSASSLEHF